MNKRRRGRTSPKSYPDQEFALLVGRIAGASGIMLALVGALVTDISLELLGLACGFSAYVLGSRRLGAAAVIISALVLVLLLTVLRSYFPGIDPTWLLVGSV